MSFLEIVETLKKEDNFLILTHTTPDGDAFGSAIALKLLLKSLNKKAEVYTEQPIPLQYKFLPHIDNLKDLKNLAPEAFNVLVLVDCNNPSRVNNDKNLIASLKNFSGKRVIIDHHIEDKKNDFNALKWIEPEESATGIMIYKLIKHLNIDISSDMAKALYTAIIVDTGNFQFDNTSDKVLSIAAELVRAGAKPSFIYQNCFEMWHKQRFQLFVRMLNRVEIIPPVVIGCITKKDFDETKTSEPDTERFVEFLRILNDIQIAALFREIEEGFFKVSLRSKGDIDVSLISREFGGGGHKNAAGYRIRANYEDARNELIKKIWEKS
ncbi:DHH family phosphoesterase [Thermodesulfovibrio hydrogeniphilus]